MDTEGIRNSNFFGVEFHYSSRELMLIEARRTRIEAIKREMGDKYLLAPLYTKLRKPLK
jgi:hypothetical protein